MYGWLLECVSKKKTQSNSDLMENLHCQVFVTVKIHIVVFWAMTPCSLVCGYQTFRGIFCIQDRHRVSNQDRRNVIVRNEKLKKYIQEHKLFSQTLSYIKCFDDIYLTAIGCIPGGSATRLQTKITYNNNQHQHYIEQTIYPPLGGCKSADRAPSLRGIP